MMERRNFLKQSCTLCLVTGAGMMAGSLSSCATLPAYQAAIVNKQIAVPVSLFAQSNLQIIQPKSFYYNIGLKKEADGTYTALLLKCTHADNQLNNNGNGYKCSLHGSAFDSEGNVTMGPAERPLQRYKTEIVNQQIIIHIS